MSQFIKSLAVESIEAAADHFAKRGYLSKLSAGKSAINDSATVAAYGVILDGEGQGGEDSVAVFGGGLGTVPFKLGGNVSKGDRLKQKNDGTVVADTGTGARVIVGIACQDGTTDEIIEGLALPPETYTAPEVVALTSTNGTAGAAADLTALKAESEKVGDDVRAIHAALVTKGILVAS